MREAESAGFNEWAQNLLSFPHKKEFIGKAIFTAECLYRRVFDMNGNEVIISDYVQTTKWSHCINGPIVFLAMKLENEVLTESLWDKNVLERNH